MLEQQMDFNGGASNINQVDSRKYSCLLDGFG